MAYQPGRSTSSEDELEKNFGQLSVQNNRFMALLDDSQDAMSQDETAAATSADALDNTQPEASSGATDDKATPATTTTAAADNNTHHPSTANGNGGAGPVSEATSASTTVAANTQNQRNAIRIPSIAAYLKQYACDTPPEQSTMASGSKAATATSAAAAAAAAPKQVFSRSLAPTSNHMADDKPRLFSSSTQTTSRFFPVQQPAPGPDSSSAHAAQQAHQTGGRGGGGEADMSQRRLDALTALAAAAAQRAEVAGAASAQNKAAYKTNTGGPVQQLPSIHVHGADTTASSGFPAPDMARFNMLNVAAQTHNTAIAPHGVLSPALVPQFPPRATGSGSGSGLARHAAMSIDDLARAGDAGRKTLVSTRPAQSWITEMPSWRNNTGNGNGNGARNNAGGGGSDASSLATQRFDSNNNNSNNAVAGNAFAFPGVAAAAPPPPGAHLFPGPMSVGIQPPPGFSAPAALPPQSAPALTQTFGDAAFAASAGAAGDRSSSTRAASDNNTTTYRRPMSSTSSTFTPFRPMQSKLDPDASKRALSPTEVAYRESKGISLAYQGQAHNPKNVSEDIPDSENCALFLTNLPPTCTYRELLRAVAAVRPGRVWSSYINPPRTVTAQDLERFAQQAAQHDDSDGRPPFSAANLPLSYRTSAAKLIFFDPREARRLLAASERHAFVVGGRRVTAKWNRHRTGAQAYENPTSRVLTISGPRSIVDEAFLRGMFDSYFEYQTEEVVVVAQDPAWRALEWRFGSMRAQAHAAHQLLRSLYPGVVAVRWTADPCAGYLVMPEGEAEREAVGGFEQQQQQQQQQQGGL